MSPANLTNSVALFTRIVYRREWGIGHPFGFSAIRYANAQGKWALGMGARLMYLSMMRTGLMFKLAGCDRLFKKDTRYMAYIKNSQPT
ncbi:hypothetical protein WKK05_29100 [Nostoc sp. UHCC 0302]|uniref:hypothetical protein n=1 Tax=Nostoc sp. UHCC 0302 TaxID=3134896 RepID=UPI00311CDF9B